MCLGIPARVVEIVEDGAVKAEVGGVRRVVSTLLLDADAVRVGDWVLVHVGFALAKIDEEQAAATLRLVQSLDGAGRDELDAWSRRSD
jgi:hydrogenase expression/formation protein HypC